MLNEIIFAVFFHKGIFHVYIYINKIACMCVCMSVRYRKEDGGL